MFKFESVSVSLHAAQHVARQFIGQSRFKSDSSFKFMDSDSDQFIKSVQTVEAVQCLKYESNYID